MNQYSNTTKQARPSILEFLARSQSSLQHVGNLILLPLFLEAGHVTAAKDTDKIVVGRLWLVRAQTTRDLLHRCIEIQSRIGSDDVFEFVDADDAAGRIRPEEICENAVCDDSDVRLGVQRNGGSGVKGDLVIRVSTYQR